MTDMPTVLMPDFWANEAVLGFQLRKTHFSYRGCRPSHELHVLAFCFLFATRSLFWDWWGLAHDWRNRTDGSWVEVFKSSFVTQKTLRFWNKASFWERNFLCNSGLLIPATNRSRRATSKCSWTLHEFAHRFISVWNQCVKLRPFNQFILDWSDVSQKCTLDFCDWSFS